MGNRREFLASIGAAASLPLASGAAPLVAPSREADPILDIHQHTFYTGRSNEQLIAHQQYHGVTITNLMPGDGWLLSACGGNADCAALQARYPGKFVRFTCADPVEGRMFDIGGPALKGGPVPSPDSVVDLGGRTASLFGLSWPAADVKMRAWGLGVRGPRGAIGMGEMKFHVPLDSPEMGRIYKLAEECHCPVLCHIEHRWYTPGIENLEKVLKRYPKMNFIGHAQTWWGHISADLNPSDLYPKGPIKPGGLIERLLADYPNVYGDLSADSGLNAITRDPDFSPGFLDRHYRKLVWGSDCPCRDGKGGGTPGGYCIAGRSLAALRRYVADKAKLHRILYENAAGLLKLNQRV